MPTSEHTLFQMAILQAWNAVVITDADASRGYRVQIANPAFCRMTGYALEELRGGTLKRLQGPETDPAVVERMRTCLQEARYFEGVALNYRKDGSPYLVRWSISPVRDPAGVLTHFVSVQQDLSDYARSELQTRLLSRALDATGDPVLITDTRSRIVFVNSAFVAITGYAEAELLGKTPALLRSGQHDRAFYAELRQALGRGEAFRATFVNRRRDGTTYHAEQSISPIFDEAGRVTHYVSVSKDISERVSLEHALRRAADLDPLTGLHNRGCGERRLAICCRQLGSDSQAALILCDIDHFKRVNDQFGHPAGDQVIRQVAAMLRQQTRADDGVFRWGGEEFLILLEAATAAQAAELAERIRQRVLAHRDAVAGVVSLSLGVAPAVVGQTPAQWVARADAALYAAKRLGRNRVCLADTVPPPG